MELKLIYNFSVAYNNISIKESIGLLDKTELKILFIIDKNNKLIGTITDGDIRRYLNSQNIDLMKNVEIIMNKAPKYILENEKEELTYEKFKKLKVNHLPVLSKDKKILKVVYFDYNFQRGSRLDNKVVIMAGGKGTRLLPLTRVIPKPLIPFKDKTIIESIMQQFIINGFDDFIITVNYKKEFIKQYFERMAYNIEFIEENEFLGTAGSIGLLRNYNIGKSFFVSNCDIILDLDYEEALDFHIKQNSHFTIIASMENIDITYGVIKTDDQSNYLSIQEKPNYNFLINTGIYILNREVIDIINTNEKVDMPELIERAKNKGMNVKIFSTHKKIIDIGHWDYYKNIIKLEH